MEKFNMMSEKAMSKTNGGLLSLLLTAVSLGACAVGLTANVTSGIINGVKSK